MIMLKTEHMFYEKTTNLFIDANLRNEILTMAVRGPIYKAAVDCSFPTFTENPVIIANVTKSFLLNC